VITKGFILALGLASTAVLSAAPAPASEDAEFFERKIRPVLANSCYECHSHQAKKNKAGLYLDNREDLLKGGETGVAVVLGEPDKSRLIEAVRWSDPDFQMPPKQKLPESAIKDLSQWVKKGAPWPKEAAPKIAVSDKELAAVEKRKREHWAWQPVKNLEPPQTKSKGWAVNGIDRFILSTLESKGLTTVPAADRRTLIRRAYFDLIGLPPSPEEILEFERDASADAYEKVVEHLLASPHYGERWGRHWLDVARYGEDQAHSFQPRLYPEGFRYRDWLVRAFNDDMPYDRFVMEQLAGDLMEGGDKFARAPALGFFALGPVYYGDGKMFDQFDDRIDTLTRGFLGLTVACARCHDHKFDPISSKDYYALAGVIASSQYVEEPLVPTEMVQAYDKAQAAIAEKTKEADGFVEKESAKIATGLLAETANYMKIAKTEGLQTFALERWVKYLDKAQKEKVAEFTKWNALLAGQDEKRDLSTNETAIAETRKVAGAVQDYLLTLQKVKSAMREHQAAAKAIGADKDKGLDLEKSKAEFLETFLGKEGVCRPPQGELEKLLPEEQRVQLVSLKGNLESLKKKAPEKYPIAHSLKDGAKPHNLNVLLRGNPETPGEEVPRHFLSVLAGGQPAAFTNGSGRLDLARAIADRKNPLTARVFVNRVWQHHFGRGLVRTTSNFGLLGEAPTHPELLDYLASQFMESGWSIKSLHRQIMLSATYRMSGKFNEKNNEKDPENKFLWRMNRRRLEVEVWRDTMLAVSGNLDIKAGGSSTDLASPENRRRTVYAKVSRHDLDALLRLFDFPDPNVTSDMRTVTTVPLQQLFFLNGEFMVRQAKALAARLTKSNAEPEEQRITQAFLTVYGRLPSEQERTLGLEFLANHKQQTASPGNGLSGWEQYAQVLLSANEFLYVD
jgi:cytochrome c553